MTLVEKQPPVIDTHTADDAEEVFVPTGNKREKFSIFWFSVQVIAQVAGMLLAVRALLPDVWTRSVAAGPGAFVACFLGMHMVMCFFEWGFHRYVLHAKISPLLGYFSKAHRNHHGLTPIKLQAVSPGSDRYVLNKYPILEEEQYEDSAFPWFALLGFWAFFTPLLAALQFAFPNLPFLIGGYAAIAMSMTFYEVLHALEHYPYEWWKAAVEHPRFGKMWTALYGFHHFHHANVGANEAISGFFGLPIADWVFGTYHQPKELLLQGRMATAKDFAVKPPPAWVRALDDWARKRESELARKSIKS